MLPTMKQMSTPSPSLPSTVKSSSCGPPITKASRRRRSRAKPKPPVTLLSAQDTTHFKAIVHHFTSVGCPLDHSLLLPHCPGLVPAGTSNPPASMAASPLLSSSAPALVFPGSAVAESLKYSLQMIFSCLELLHKTSSSSVTTIKRSNAELDMFKRKTSLVMQALGKAAGLFQEDASNNKQDYGNNFSDSCMKNIDADDILVDRADPTSALDTNPSDISCDGISGWGAAICEPVNHGVNQNNENQSSMQGNEHNRGNSGSAMTDVYAAQGEKKLPLYATNNNMCMQNAFKELESFLF